MKSIVLTKYASDLKVVSVAIIYYLSAVFGYFLAFEGTTALPAWPPSGIAFALIILLGRQSWPGITIGALIANVMAYWNMPELPTYSIIAISSFIAIGNTIEALIGNYLVKNWISEISPFQRTKNAFRFLFITIFMAFIGSGIGSLSLLSNGVVLSSEYLKAMLSLWVGNVVGILLFTPFILSVFKKHHIKFSKENLLEIVLFIIGITILGFLLQTQDFDQTFIRALPFLVLPFLMWLAFRFELLVSMTGVVLTSIFAIYLTTQNIGPFVLSDSYSSMILLQIFIGVVSITTIILSATVKERADAQEELLKFNENLEDRVKARTKELKDEIATRREAEETLQQTNKELSKRNIELDNFVYSVSHDLRAPIASVLGLINLAKTDKDAAMKDMYFDMINNSALQQDNFIREFLDQSRNSRLELKRDKIEFQEIIDNSFDQLKHASTTGSKVTKIINVDQDRPFYSDPWRIKVILNNLISNAIRYRNGKDPVINIDVVIKNKKAVLTVEDNGRGISKDHLNKVCDMFYRATDDGAGSGLGLYIVREAIDKLHGEIKIESEEGKGTKVIFEVPQLAVTKNMVA